MKRWYFLCPFLFTIFGLLLIGCGGKKKSTEPPPEPNYFPMTVGSYWEYQKEGTQRNMRHEVLAKGTYRTLPVTIVEVTYQPPLDTNPVLYDSLFIWETKNQITIFEKEVWRYTDGTIYAILEDSVGEVILNYPLDVGKTWFYGDNEDLKINVEVLSKETVSIPAGVFEDCYKIFYYWEPDKDRHYTWFAPDVGMVKIKDPWNNYTYILKDYKLQ